MTAKTTSFSACIQVFDAADNLVSKETIDGIVGYIFEHGCFHCSGADFAQMRMLRPGEIVTVTKDED